MKKMKVLAIGAVMALALSGCGGKVTTESLMKEANENIAKIESAEMNVSMDMQADISVMGMTLDMDINADIDMVMTNDPMIVHSKGTMTVNAMGESENTTIESYSEQDGSKSIIYNKLEDGSWEKTEGDSLEGTADLFSDTEIGDMIESLELAEDTESVNQIESYKISGEVKGSVIEESLNSIFGDQEGAEMFGNLDLDDATVPVEYYIAKADRKPVKVSMDLKDIIKDSMEQVMKESMGDVEVDIEMSVDTCIMEITYLSFDSVDKIEIPAEAKNASEASSEDALAALEALLGGEAEEETEEVEEETTEEVQTEEAQTEEVTEAPAAEPAAAGGDGADISSAIKMEATSAENGAPLGQWLEITQYSTVDQKYHPIYIRATKITTTEQDATYVDNCISENNAIASERNQIDIADLELPEDVEACILEYEVHIPADFPSEEWGLSSPDVFLNASNVDGGGIPSATSSSSYIGLGFTETLEQGDIEKYDVEYMPGNTFSFRTVFFMVQGFEDYSFDGSTVPAGEEEGIVYYYLANK